MSELVVRSEQRCFGGVQGFYEHPSAACAGPMRFAVYRPPQALAGGADAARVPVVYYLPGLTGTEETCVIKGGAPFLGMPLAHLFHLMAELAHVLVLVGVDLT